MDDLYPECIRIVLSQEKIESAGGECIAIDEIIESNPKGSNIRIME